MDKKKNQSNIRRPMSSFELFIFWLIMIFFIIPIIFIFIGALVAHLLI